jgi:hypothetical protein
MQADTPVPVSPTQVICGRFCVISAAAFLVWSISVYPVAFAYEAREASASRLGFYAESMKAITSGWFTGFLCASSALGTWPGRWLGTSMKWKWAGVGICLLSVALMLVHLAIDGPIFVGRSVWVAVSHVNYFLEPIYYFQVAVENWGAWP